MTPRYTDLRHENDQLRDENLKLRLGGVCSSGPLEVWIVCKVWSDDGTRDPVAAFTNHLAARAWAMRTYGPETYGSGSRDDPIGLRWDVKGLVPPQP